MKITFFRTPKPKRFDFKPRYYDEDKEKSEKRKAAREGKLEPGEYFKSEIERRWKRKDRSKNASTKSMILYLIIAAITVYLIFFLK